MRRYTELKIGPHLCRIQYVSGLDDCGVNSRERGIITINDDIIESEQGVTLFHEVLHKINGELDEVMVDFLAHAIFQVLDENDMLK